jgi:UDP-N-acetyl-2-amino-2-deoxyglucuronate dehydrogenase
MSKYKVGIIGCGAIFNRHLEGIEANDDFELVAICDINEGLVESLGDRLGVDYYTEHIEMVLRDDINFLVVATPNDLHKDHAKIVLRNGCDVLIEKPVSFKKDDLIEIQKVADDNNQKAYCVLQVRLNATVKVVKEILEENLLGDIRGFSFTQRWQRPLEYFSGWRGEPAIGGGILYEVGIHYLDILQQLIGLPNEVVDTKTYITKHKGGVIEDTVYSILDYGDFGGTVECTIASEPRNLESSISLLGSNGYIKIGGKALNIIEAGNFLSSGAQKKFDKICNDNPWATEPNSYGSYLGSCPNHPTLYANLEKFDLSESLNVISLIEDIYNKSDLKY